MRSINKEVSKAAAFNEEVVETFRHDCTIKTYFCLAVVATTFWITTFRIMALSIIGKHALLNVASKSQQWRLPEC
jgi:hypothetical protein